MTQIMAQGWHTLVDLPDCPEWLQALRTECWAKFEANGWPTGPDHKYSDYSDLAEPRPIAAPGTVTKGQLKPFLAGDEAALLVFVDGQYAPELSHADVEGLVAGRLRDNLDRPQTRHHFQAMAGRDDPMHWLHLSTWQDGAFVLAEDAIEGPVHVMMVNTGTHGARSLHHAYVTDQQGDVTILESHVHLADDEGATLNFAVFVAGDNTHLRHVKVQKEDRRARHLSTQHALVLGHATATSVVLDLGGDASRQTLQADLVQEGGEVDLQGVFFGQREQRKDLFTRVQHAVPHCRSHEVFKGILDDQSRGAFTGSVIVHPGAHGTHSEQENRNLLLSDKAHVDTTPQLEIHNDDVQCSHGSTIGQLQPDQLFFLRARGIDKQRARMMLTRAFASEIIEGVTHTSIRKLLDRYLHLWFIKHQEHLA